MLDRTKDGAILATALQALAEVGYDRLTMDEIAARAHVGKGALYRRWSSKAALVVDAVTDWHRRQAPAGLPDTGSLRGDLAAIVAAVPEDGDAGGGEYVALVAGLSTAATRDPELGAALAERVLDGPRRALRELLDRAAARGEIAADRELDLVPDILMGLNLLRTVVGRSVDREFVRRVFDEVVLPLVSAPGAPGLPSAEG
jgi:AcrR family transcriptional regulator